MFSGFDFRLLNDPDFKEDSVREELIVPLLRELGYTASGPAKIIRSKPLTHPFVYIGSTKHKINIIPDYLLVVDDEHRWVLDAKAPNENILKGKNPEQAFSYAIHPEVRADRYALCNGHQLVVFDVRKVEPVLVVDMKKLSKRFDKVMQFLSPLAFTKPHIFSYKPDLGLYLWKLGMTSDHKFVFMDMGVPMLAKVEDGKYTFFVNINFIDTWLATSFDFDDERFEQLISALPPERAVQARDALRRQPYSIYFEGKIPEVGVSCHLGRTVHSNENEDYCPLIVERFFAAPNQE